MKYTVWVGGIKVTDYLLSKNDAMQIAEQYKNHNCTDVIIEEVK